MPVYLHPANLIIQKQTVETKYAGGTDQFRKDYLNETHPETQEDDELFSLAAWNDDEFDLMALTEKGLAYNIESAVSEDFVIYLRYSGLLWPVSWLNENKIFAWHIACHPALIRKAKYIGEETTLEQIEAAFNQGENPFRTIRGL